MYTSNVYSNRYNRTYLLEAREVLMELRSCENLKSFISKFDKDFCKISIEEVEFISDSLYTETYNSLLELTTEAIDKVEMQLGKIDYEAGYVSVYSKKYLEQLVNREPDSSRLNELLAYTYLIVS